MKYTQVEYQHAEREDDEEYPEQEHVEFPRVEIYLLIALSYVK